jgi:hypothetical protein
MLWPDAGDCAPIGYSITVTTAYSNGNPFANQIDSVFSEPDTGYIQIANTGESTFSGVIGTIAVSAFAGDLSFASNPMLLAPGATVSIAMPDDSAAVGGFNGPAYFYRPGVEIYLDGSVSNAAESGALNLLVADSDIHSGVSRTDSFGLTSDSFVLQSGDPWGFDTVNTFALSQADGVSVFSGTVPEPGSAQSLAVGVAALGAVRCLPRRFRSRRA